MSPVVAALLGSLIGASAGLAGSIVSNIVAVRNEKRRLIFAARAAYIQSLRERAGTTFAAFFRVIQAIEWVSWYGDNDPDAIDREFIKSYEGEVNGIYGDLVGALAMMASLSLDIYEEMRTALPRLYALEARVGVALRRVQADRTAAIAALGECASQAASMREELLPKLSKIVRQAESMADTG